jgi:hypothetical protein
MSYGSFKFEKGEIRDEGLELQRKSTAPMVVKGFF